MLFIGKAQVKEDKTEEQNFTAAATRAATHTNYKLIWVLLGLVAAFTVGFCYLFYYVLRLAKSHRRNGERLKDVMRVRLNEQDKKY